METVRMPIVHQMRSGAPDKICLWTDGSYLMRAHDNTNLVDYDLDELAELYRNEEYILPADEGDILHANEMFTRGLVDQQFILLPLTVDNIVIAYGKFVPKDSMIYKYLQQFTGVKYAEFELMDLLQFKTKYIQDSAYFDRKAIKTATGSGSRGVILVDPDRVHLGGKYVDNLDSADLDGFCKFVEKEDCKILIQDLIPYEPDRLMKCNVDFVIRDGKLLGYKWDYVNQSQQFTNWDNGYFVRNEYLDDLMSKVAKYLVTNGIMNAIMNFECFSDMESETWMVEFNWRYSNSMFEGQALNIDLISCYLNNTPFEVPMGSHKFARYWQCALYSDINRYHIGK